MRIFLVVAICLWGRVVFSQHVPSISLPTDESGLVKFQRVVKLNGSLSAQAITTKAIAWAESNYDKTTSAGKTSNLELGGLIVLGIYPFDNPTSVFRNGQIQEGSIPYKVRYILTLEASTGQYKVTIDNLVLESSSNGGAANSLQLPPKPSTVEQYYQAMKNLPLDESTKRKNAELTFANFNQLLGQIQQHMDGRLQSLEKSMEQ